MLHIPAAFLIVYLHHNDSSYSIRHIQFNQARVLCHNPRILLVSGGVGEESEPDLAKFQRERNAFPTKDSQH